MSSCRLAWLKTTAEPPARPAREAGAISTQATVISTLPRSSSGIISAAAFYSLFG
jgi:hypothetical protein